MKAGQYKESIRGGRKNMKTTLGKELGKNGRTELNASVVIANTQIYI